MQDCLQDGSSCFQYADDTMVLHHPTPEDFDVDGYTPPLTLKDKTVDRVEKFKLLGTWLSEDITWKEHVNEVTSSRYKVLATLRRIKNMTPQETEKSIGQSLELSKLNFNYYVTYPPHFCRKEFNVFRMLAAGFVLNRFCSERDVLELGWLPTQYTIKHS